MLFVRILTVSLLVVLVGSTPAAAEFFRYVAPDGAVYYGNVPFERQRDARRNAMPDEYQRWLAPDGSLELTYTPGARSAPPRRVYQCGPAGAFGYQFEPCTIAAPPPTELGEERVNPTSGLGPPPEPWVSEPTRPAKHPPSTDGRVLEQANLVVGHVVNSDPLQSPEATRAERPVVPAHPEVSSVVATRASLVSLPLSVDNGFAWIFTAVVGLAGIAVALVVLVFWHERRGGVRQQAVRPKVSARDPAEAQRTETPILPPLPAELNCTERALRRALVVLFALVPWAVVGFGFWLAILLRNAVVVLVASLKAAVVGCPNTALGGIIDTATAYYHRGFRTIKESLRENPPSETRSLKGTNVRFVIDSVYTLLVWGLTLFAVSASFRSEVQRWLSVLLSSNWLPV